MILKERLDFVRFLFENVEKKFPPEFFVSAQRRSTVRGDEQRAMAQRDLRLFLLHSHRFGQTQNRLFERFADQRRFRSAGVFIVRVRFDLNERFVFERRENSFYRWLNIIFQIRIQMVENRLADVGLVRSEVVHQPTNDVEGQFSNLVRRMKNSMNKRSGVGPNERIDTM